MLLLMMLTVNINKPMVLPKANYKENTWMSWLTKDINAEENVHLYTNFF